MGLDREDDEDTVTVVVEFPRGSRNKYEFDEGEGAFFLDRMLFTSMQYPADCGFIDGTLGATGTSRARALAPRASAGATRRSR